MSQLWASAKTKGQQGASSLKQSWASTGDSHIPKSAIIILAICLIGAFIWILVYFIHLEEGKKEGKEEKTSGKGECSDACAEDVRSIMKEGVLGPVILGFAGIFVAWLIVKKQRDKYAQQHIFRRAGLATSKTFHVSYERKKISKSAFLAIAFVVWIVVVVGIYLAVTYVPLKAFKKSLYKQYTTGSACKAAKKKWCKNAAPNSKIVIGVSTAGMLAILIASFFIFRTKLTPEQAMMRDQCERVAMNIEQSLKANPSIASGATLEEYWDENYEHGEGVSFEQASGEPIACGPILTELKKTWRMAQSKQTYVGKRNIAAGGGAGFVRPKSGEAAFSQVYSQKMLAKQRKMQAQKLAQAQAALQAKQSRQTMASEAQSHAQAMQSLKSQMASVGQASSTTATPISPRPPPFAPQSPPETFSLSEGSVVDGQAVPTAPPMPPPNSPVAGQNIRY